MTRRICVVTGSRADYGHLQPVMEAMRQDSDLALQVLVCGQHLDSRFGDTWKAIAADGFDIQGKVGPSLTDDSRLAVAQATGRTISGVATELDRLRPDIVLVLGDRYEIFAAGAAAMILGIPVAHIHGGEITEAAMDDAMRHALSKMAALHFTAAEPYRARLIQMGEDPAQVILSGAPGLDHLQDVAPLTLAGLAQELKIAISDPLFLITYHPVTLKEDGGAGGLSALLGALECFSDATMVFSGVNSDFGHARLRERIASFVAADPRRRIAVESLGYRRYLGAMQSAAAVIGNSSSGLIEAPALGVPTVNIGNRQKGRLRSATVIDCAEDQQAIWAAINRALSPTFREDAARTAPAYRCGGAAQHIVNVLKNMPLTQLSAKRFHDIIAEP